MLNLLPQEEKSRLVKDYRLKYFTVVALFVSILLGIAIIGLFPSYMSIKAENTSLERIQQQAEESNNEASLKEANDIFYSNKSKADFLEAQTQLISNNPSYANLISKIFSFANSGIFITGITITNDVITIAGTASTRTDLISFNERLKQDDDLRNAVLPISDLARSTDANFNIQISL